MAQVAGTDHNHVSAAVYAKDVGDLIAKIRYNISITLLAEFAKMTKILTDLRWCHVHLLAQSLRGDAGDTPITQIG